jgi:hypothetical protein
MIRYLIQLFRPRRQHDVGAVKSKVCCRCQKPLTEGSSFCIACGTSNSGNIIERQAAIEVKLQQRKKKAEKARDSLGDIDLDFD